MKIRLIHDLSRSGVNHRIQLRERVILPKLSDALVDIIHVIQKNPGQQVDLIALDFKDAFKQLRVDPKESRFLSGRFSAGWFVYTRI